jgi:hypothetical protein
MAFEGEEKVLRGEVTKSEAKYGNGLLYGLRSKSKPSTARLGSGISVAAKSGTEVSHVLTLFRPHDRTKKESSIITEIYWTPVAARLRSPRDEAENCDAGTSAVAYLGRNKRNLISKVRLASRV